VRPACVRWRAPWFRWAGCEQVDQCPHGQDGHAPFLLRYKVSFQRDNGIIEPFSVHAFTFFEQIIDIHSRFLFILSE